MKAEHDWIASSPDDLRAFGIDATSAPFALDRAKVAVYRATQIYCAAMASLSLCRLSEKSPISVVARSVIERVLRNPKSARLIAAQYRAIFSNNQKSFAIVCNPA